MTAVILYDQRESCTRAGYPVVGKPTIVSPYFVLCACPSCKPAAEMLLEEWKRKGTVEQFTIRARSHAQAVQEGRRLDVWAKGLVRSRGRTRPAASRRKRMQS